MPPEARSSAFQIQPEITLKPLHLPLTFLQWLSFSLTSLSSAVADTRSSRRWCTSGSPWGGSGSRYPRSSRVMRTSCKTSLPPAIFAKPYTLGESNITLSIYLSFFFFSFCIKLKNTLKLHLTITNKYLQHTYLSAFIYILFYSILSAFQNPLLDTGPPYMCVCLHLYVYECVCTCAIVCVSICACVCAYKYITKK